MKKKLLFVGINMNCGGTEKSFLSFVSCVDFSKYEVDLVLARKDGLFLSLVPSEVNIYTMEDYGDMFFLSSKNAVPLLLNTFIKRDPLTAFTIAPYFLAGVADKAHKPNYAIRMWVRLSRKLKPFRPDVCYDAAFAYWGDRSMFYMVDKVKAKKKIAWLHFDYDYPPRDDKTYARYFDACDAIINVSKAVDDSLKAKFPAIAHKCHIIENINSKSLIMRMAQEGNTYTDTDFKGLRILTVGRIAPQKGYDLAAKALGKVIRAGYDVRWYVLGDGDDSDKKTVTDVLDAENLRDRMIFLGSTVNPYRYMKDCDVYAQPSRFEGKPIAVEEAKLLEKPILAAEYLSAREQLADGRYGVITAIDPNDIALGLIELLSSPQKRQELSQVLREEQRGNEDEFLKILPLIQD